METRNVVVIGCLNFVGSAIANAFHERYPTCLTQALNNCMVLCGVLGFASLASVLRHVEPEVVNVINTAGIVPLLSERYHRRIEEGIRRVNGGGSHDVLNATKEVVAIYITDDWSYPYPNIDEKLEAPKRSSIYDKSKVEAEKIILAANSPTKGETPFIIGSADDLWDITYVTDVADAHVLSAENLVSNNPTAAGEMFFIQNNTPATFRDFILAVRKEFGHIPSDQTTISEILAWTAGLLADAASWLTGSRELTLNRVSVNDACAVRYVNGEKARIALKYEARVGLEGIRLSCEK